MTPICSTELRIMRPSQVDTRFTETAEIHLTPREVPSYGLGIFQIWMPPEFRNEFSRGAFITYVLPQNSLPLPRDLKSKVANIINNPKYDCAAYIKQLLAATQGTVESDDAITLYERVEGEGGF